MNEQERQERLALTAVRATSGCRTFEPEVCSACAARLDTARSAVNATINYEREAIARLVDMVSKYRMATARGVSDEGMRRGRWLESIHLSELALDIRNGEHGEDGIFGEPYDIPEAGPKRCECDCGCNKRPMEHWGNAMSSPALCGPCLNGYMP